MAFRLRLGNVVLNKECAQELNAQLSIGILDIFLVLARSLEYVKLFLRLPEFRKIKTTHYQNIRNERKIRGES